MADRTAYEVLQVTPDAHEAVIRAAYRALAAIYHPDSDPSPTATRRMTQLNDAYDKLRTRDRRDLYDKSLALLAKVASPSATTASTAPGQNGRASTSRARNVLDFGRYEGRTLTEIAKHDPDYLRWLSRHSSGIRYRREIAELLAAEEDLKPAPRSRRR